MSTLFDEGESDREVIRVLINELRKSNSMQKFIKEDGKIYAITQYDEVTEDQLRDRIVSLQRELSNLEAVVGNGDTNQPADQQLPSPESQPPQSAENAPTNVETPPQQPTEQPTPQPAAPSSIQ